MSANQMANENQQDQNGGVGQNGLNQCSNGDHRAGFQPRGHGGTSKHLRTTLLDFEGCSDKVDAAHAPLVDHRPYHRTHLFFFLHL